MVYLHDANESKTHDLYRYSGEIGMMWNSLFRRKKKKLLTSVPVLASWFGRWVLRVCQHAHELPFGLVLLFVLVCAESNAVKDIVKTHRVHRSPNRTERSHSAHSSLHADMRPAGDLRSGFSSVHVSFHRHKWCNHLHSIFTPLTNQRSAGIKYKVYIFAFEMFSQTDYGARTLVTQFASSIHDTPHKGSRSLKKILIKLFIITSSAIFHENNSIFCPRVRRVSFISSKNS